MAQKIKHYTANSKMADLLSDHYSIFLLIFRFDIPLGMGEKTINEVCEENNVDVYTFLFVVHFILFQEKSRLKDLHKKLDIPLIIRFLKNSHAYFTGFRLPEIRKDMLEAIESAPKDIVFVIERYFDEYAKEVDQHMKYENEVVFTYSEKLLNGTKDPKYSIDIFAKKHDKVELKMLELKHIFIKYYQFTTSYKLNNVLHELYTCGEELENHNAVENDIFIPCMRELEQILIEKK